MERIFRDERVPDLEIRHSGGSTYDIWVRGGPMQGYHTEDGWTNTDCFTRYPDKGCPDCSHDGSGTCAKHAEIAAQEHFDEMASEDADDSDD